MNKELKGINRMVINSKKSKNKMKFIQFLKRNLIKAFFIIFFVASILCKVQISEASTLTVSAKSFFLIPFNKILI